MLTIEEKNFIEYWEQNRNKKKRLMWQLAAGLPLGVFMAIGIFVNFFSGWYGWYRRAAMKINVNASGFFILLLALLLIVIFVGVFSARHKWEMNEQRYKELNAKKDID